jgi:membrane protein YqaA with SNARE-associated domain
MPRGGERPDLAEGQSVYRPGRKWRQTRRIGAAQATQRRAALPAEGWLGQLPPTTECGPPILELHYLGLFTSAVLAATMLPGASEILMLRLLGQGLDSWTLWLVATVGNLAGSTLNWWLGRFALRYADRRWFPVSGAAPARAQGWIHRWGQPALLLSWLPGVGDAFTVAAGVMRTPILPFLVLVAVAKGGRHAAVLGAGHGLDIGSWF